MTDLEDVETRAQSEPWISYLEDDIEFFEKGSIEQDATVIIRDVLAAESINEATIKEAALRLDKYDKDIRLGYDPMETMVHAARFIPYDNALQHRLVQLLHELMETPTGPAYSDTLSRQLEKDWNGVFPNMRSPIDSDESRAIWKQKCDEWLNFSVFKTRTLVAGICAHYPDWSFKAPLKDIAIGLKLRGDISGDVVFADCMLMVAAQHILIAGEAIRSQFTKVQDPGKGLHQTRWKIWTEQFDEVSNLEGLEASTRLAAGKAHQKMMALWPEIFSDGGSQISTEAETSELPGSK